MHRPKTIAPSGPALASDGNKIYFTPIINGVSTIASCDITDAMTGACMAAELVHPAGDGDFSSLRKLEVVGGKLYASGDGVGSASVWRIAL